VSGPDDEFENRAVVLPAALFLGRPGFGLAHDQDIQVPGRVAAMAGRAQQRLPGVTGGARGTTALA
jgi:hypothetical protein